ncbi:MAG: hypothetical protein M1828_004354 [Chrysothrix sp. TS-e1954]|nr:MAG: hypothetical protein M1828_004354 [Chrysothrix sp. TS-e1954]
MILKSLSSRDHKNSTPHSLFLTPDLRPAAKEPKSKKWASAPSRTESASTPSMIWHHTPKAVNRNTDDYPNLTAENTVRKRHPLLSSSSADNVADLRYFPAELRKIIKPQKTIHATKADALRRRRKTRKLAELQEANDGDEEKPLDEEAMVGKDEEIDNASDLQDASYSDEEGGDYNAETYFDGGAEDVDDVAAEGGDDYD